MGNRVGKIMVTKFRSTQSMSALRPEADILCVERNYSEHDFPTRFPTELLTTGWEMAGLDG